ncbi:unnamed protein product [Dibothriocephalus latus]|uniref:USP domain-containing protein n=1 Tax=Dibothriocephalus latus TaxID=60516 RepID=A0A3P7P4K0_DIBLA|nr:unnamed protein product [Dibothriocephalus latus]
MNSVVSDSSTTTAASTISAPTVSLKDCLETFTKKEDLDGDDMPFCERCKKHAKTQLQILFSDLPEILILRILLKAPPILCSAKQAVFREFLRFDSSNSHNKRRNLIDFDFELDLAKYTTKGMFSIL